MEDAESIIARWGSMEADRALWDGLWQDVADYAVPRKNQIKNRETGPGTNPANRLYDTTAIDSVSVLASGHSTAITPAGTQWFAWEAPEDIKSDVADAWYNKAGEVARKILTAGNFHTMLNEAFEDRAGFGLCCIGAFPHPENGITFQAHPVASYCVEEDADGNVNTIFLKRAYTIAQLCEKFGEKAIAGNEKLAKSYADFQTKGLNGEHEVIHAVFPRLKRAAKKRDKFNMRFASVWIALDGKSVLDRSGFEELPYMVSRYLKRSGGKQQYGYSPFEQVKAAIVSVNKAKQILQVVRQKQAVPPILTPDDLVGNVDIRPGGRTVFNSRSKHLPQEWLTNSNAQGLIEEIADDREAIRKAYHTDLFRMFADREKQMTAREVAELSAEKLMPFSPSFTRFTADFQVMMDRIFSILFRAEAFGKLSELPPEVVRLKGGAAEVPPPKVIYQSRIALALRQQETAASDRLVERAMTLAELDPGALDNIDVDQYLRLSARNDGVSEKILRAEKAILEIRAARAEAQQQQAQLEQAKLAAEAAGKVGIQYPQQTA